VSPIWSGVVWSSAPKPLLTAMSPVRKVQAGWSWATLVASIWVSPAKRVPALVLPQAAQSTCGPAWVAGCTAATSVAAMIGAGWNARSVVATRASATAAARPREARRHATLPDRSSSGATRATTQASTASANSRETSGQNANPTSQTAQAPVRTNAAP
jgi:hypothetical protein